MSLHPPPRSDGTLWRLISHFFPPPGSPLPMIHPNLNFAKNNNCVPHRPRDQAQKRKKNFKEWWTQLTLRMRETTRARFRVGFLIFSFPWFSHTYPHSNRIYPSTRIRHISGLFLLPRTPLGVLETEHASRWYKNLD